MTVTTATMIWTGVAAYLAAGLLFAVMFAFGGAVRIDRAAKGSGLFFRALIVPGAALLWPLLLLMWVFGAGADKRDAA